MSVGKRLNEIPVECPGCENQVNPFVILDLGDAEKDVECPNCSQVFKIRWSLNKGGWETEPRAAFPH